MQDAGQVVAVTAGTAVGMALLAAGASKLRDLRAVDPFLRALGLPPDVARAVRTGLPVAELAIGTWLASAVALRPAAAVGCALLLGFVAAQALAVLRGVAEPCRCYGSLDRSGSHRLALARALLLLAGATVALAAAEAGGADGTAWTARGLGSLLALAALLAFALAGEVTAFRSGTARVLAAGGQQGFDGGAQVR